MRPSLYRGQITLGHLYLHLWERLNRLYHIRSVLINLLILYIHLHSSLGWINMSELFGTEWCQKILYCNFMSLIINITVIHVNEIVKTPRSVVNVHFCMFNTELPDKHYHGFDWYALMGCCLENWSQDIYVCIFVAFFIMATKALRRVVAHSAPRKRHNESGFKFFLQ